MIEQPEMTEDQELRLECARLAAVFSGGGDVTENADKLYRFIKAERAEGEGA